MTSLVISSNYLDFSYIDIILYVLFCVSIALWYRLAKCFVEGDKPQSWIIMLLASFVLSLFGSYYVYDASINDLWSSDYIYGEDYLARCAVLFFAAVNMVDLMVAYIYHPKQIDVLSTLAHHIGYFIFSITLLNYHYSRGMVVCYFMEIPTFILAIGTVLPSTRSDLIFGILFFITRIAYNIFLATTLARISWDGLIWKICTMVLCVHFYWFYKWIVGYTKKRKINKDE